MIELEGVSFSWGDALALREVSLRVDAGEHAFLVGPNGAGKSTLLRLVAGILAPGAGKVRVDGKETGDLSRAELARLVSFVPQETNPSLPFTAWEVVMMARAPHLGRWRLESKRDAGAAEEAMRSMGVWGLRGRAFSRLSGGERKLVTIARALAQEARAMLLDEPEAFLDLAHARKVRELLAGLSARGLSVLEATHDLNTPLEAGGKVAVLADGRLEETGDPGGVLTPELVERVYGVAVERHALPDGRSILFPPRAGTHEDTGNERP